MVPKQAAIGEQNPGRSGLGSALAKPGRHR
jgi:hypothetical protein